MSFLERVDQSIRRSAAWRSIFRQPYPADERSRAMAVMNNVFLHLHPVRVRQHAVKFAYTFCLGGLSFFLFLALTITGVYLMFFYVPSATQAYNDILRIQSEVLFGLLTRNVHRWAAHLMVFFVFLHTMRVSITAPTSRRVSSTGWSGSCSSSDHLPVLHRLSAALGPDRLLGHHHRLQLRGERAGLQHRLQAAHLRWPRGRPEHAAALLRPARRLPALDRGVLSGRPLLADPEGRRHLRAAVGGWTRTPDDRRDPPAGADPTRRARCA